MAIKENEENSQVTLCFMHSKRKRYKATMEKFKIYSKSSPVISRGRGADQVLVALHMKMTRMTKANIGKQDTRNAEMRAGYKNPIICQSYAAASSR